jgi:quinol monooxygenase YgiN
MENPMSSAALFIIHKTKPGLRDQVKEVWIRHMAPAIESNPGHLAYFYNYDSSDPDSICAFQQYSSAEAASEFLGHPSYLKYLEEVEPLLAGPPEVKSLIPQWIKIAA